jgi:hypothetical protein
MFVCDAERTLDSQGNGANLYILTVWFLATISKSLVHPTEILLRYQFVSTAPCSINNTAVAHNTRLGIGTATTTLPPMKRGVERALVKQNATGRVDLYLGEAKCQAEPERRLYLLLAVVICHRLRSHSQARKFFTKSQLN